MKIIHYILPLVLWSVDGSEKICYNKSLKILTHDIIPRNKEKIELPNCRILELGHKPFRNNTNAFFISLKSNYIRTLSRKHLQDLPELQYFDITDNLLSIIDPEMFKGFKDIYDVSLSHNYLDLTLLPNLFIGANITKLYASYNNRDLYTMDGLPKKKYSLDHVFGLIDVDSLYLNGNSYSNVKKDVFKDLPSLRILELCNNEISAIEPSLFDRNTNLEYLCLSGNRLKEVDHKLFAKNLNLISVNLNDNYLQKLPFDLFIRNVKLKMLELSNNNFSKVNEANFYFAPTLTHLYLDGNNLKSIPDESFMNNLQLKTINLNDNDIEEIPEQLFSKNEKLQCIFLARNNLKQLPKTLLKNNNELHTLQLSNNFLSNLNGVIVPRRIRNLLLDHNQLKEVPEDQILDKFSLGLLNLDKNFINSLPWTTLMALPSLDRLHISRNFIVQLPKKMFEQLTKKVYVNMAMNPFKCACLNPYLPRNKSQDIFIEKQLFSDGKAPYCILDKLECDDSPINDQLMTEWQDIMFLNYNASFTTLANDMNQIKNLCMYF